MYQIKLLNYYEFTILNPFTCIYWKARIDEIYTVRAQRDWNLLDLFSV